MLLKILKYIYWTELEHQDLDILIKQRKLDWWLMILIVIMTSQLRAIWRIFIKLVFHLVLKEILQASKTFPYISFFNFETKLKSSADTSSTAWWSLVELPARQLYTTVQPGPGKNQRNYVDTSVDLVFTDLHGGFLFLHHVGGLLLLLQVPPPMPCPRSSLIQGCRAAEAEAKQKDQTCSKQQAWSLHVGLSEVPKNLVVLLPLLPLIPLARFGLFCSCLKHDYSQDSPPAPPRASSRALAWACPTRWCCSRSHWSRQRSG